ncbi:hypothetical protein H6785_00620 [Candidatus Nomurabacteria bacterium]|nr:hypothetical protein [Candidatus Nomurabacteria bacterium]
MFTVSRALRKIICLIVILTTPLFGEVFAQSEEVNDQPLAIDPALDVTTNESDENQDTSWYKSEQLGGRIDVGDFVVGPGRTEMELKPGDTVVQEILVTNRISDNKTFKFEIEDIAGSADGGNAVNLSVDERGPYSITDYISIPKDTITLKLGERAKIPVTITIPPDAEPGGHYGSVLVSTIRNPEVSLQDAPRSPIIARVGSLFFVTVAGEVEQSGVTKEIKTTFDKKWYESGPIEFGILYENTGSIHNNPYGEMSIKNMLGEEVGFIELEPWFVLPKSLRLREVSWDREFLLGRYMATAKINRGYDDIVDEVSTTFWVLPWKVVGGIFLILFIILFSFRAFFRTFEFKRKEG